MNTRKVLGGAVIALLAVLFSGLLTPFATGLSYSRYTWAAYADVVYPAEETGDIGDPACSDGVDNDNDGLFDCADPDCFGISPCAKSTPALSTVGLFTLVVLLAIIGPFLLRAGRRRA